MNLHLSIDWIRRRICLHERMGPQPLPIRVILSGAPNITFRGTHMAFTLPDDRTATLSIAPVDAKGNPAPIDGIPAWTTADFRLLDLIPSADGLSVQVRPVGPLAAGVQVTVTADADLGEGVETLIGMIEVDIVGGKAVALGISGQLDAPEMPAVA